MTASCAKDEETAWLVEGISSSQVQEKQWQQRQNYSRVTQCETTVEKSAVTDTERRQGQYVRERKET